MTNSTNTSLFPKLVLSLVSVFVFIILSELTLRVIDPELGYKNQFFPVNRDIDFPEIYKKDPKLFWKLRENKTIGSRWFSHLSYQINSRGLRGPEITKNKNGTRILALGNSCTFGWGVQYENCWTKVLQDKLNETSGGESIEVINAGVPGYSSHQGKILLEKLMPLDPDIVLVMYGWNDHWRAGKDISDARQKSPPAVVMEVQNYLSRLMLYKLVRKATLSLTEDTTFVKMEDMSGTRRVSPDEFSENLKSIIKRVQAAKAKPILVIPPIATLDTYFKDMSSDLHLLHQRYQNVIVKVGEYQKVPVIDLQQAFDNFDDLYDDAFGDPIHFNQKGHQIAAGQIAEFISPHIFASEN